MNNVSYLILAFICLLVVNFAVHHIENELDDPSHMKSIVRTSLILCSSVYVATSFFGFLLFGEQKLDDVLANFDGDLGITIRIHMFTSYLDVVYSALNAMGYKDIEIIVVEDVVLVNGCLFGLFYVLFNERNHLKCIQQCLC